MICKENELGSVDLGFGVPAERCRRFGGASMYSCAFGFFLTRSWELSFVFREISG